MTDLTQFDGHTPGPWSIKTGMNDARLIRSAPELLRENQRLRAALRACVDAVNDVSWGYDGDCGVVDSIKDIVDAALEESDD